MRADDLRFIAAPTEKPTLLTIEQMLMVWQSLGLSLEQSSSAVTVVAVENHIVLCKDGVPYLVRSREEWQESLIKWQPQLVQLRKE